MDSQCWGFPVAPFPRNFQIVAFHAKFEIPSIYIDRYFQLFDLVSNSLSEQLNEILNFEPGQRPWAELMIFNIIEYTTWHIGALQLAHWSILVF